MEDDGFDDVELDQNPDQGVRAPIEVFQGFILFDLIFYNLTLPNPSGQFYAIFQHAPSRAHPNQAIRNTIWPLISTCRC